MKKNVCQCIWVYYVLWSRSTMCRNREWDIRLVEGKCHFISLEGIQDIIKLKGWRYLTKFNNVATFIEFDHKIVSITSWCHGVNHGHTKLHYSCLYLEDMILWWLNEVGNETFPFAIRLTWLVVETFSFARVGCKWKYHDNMVVEKNMVILQLVGQSV